MGSNPTGGIDVCLFWVSCVLSGRGLCDELITRPEESYRLCCVVVCDLETSKMRKPWTALGRSNLRKKSMTVPESGGSRFLITSFSTSSHCIKSQNIILSSYHPPQDVVYLRSDLHSRCGKITKPRCPDSVSWLCRLSRRYNWHKSL